MWGSEGIAPVSLYLGTGRGWMVGFTPLLLYPWERAGSTHWTGGWLDPRATGL